MFENSSEELAYHKLLILYILEKINMDLTNSQITQVVLETEVMNYFSLQQFLAQLMESKFLTIYEDSNKEYYTLTKKGIETLDYFLTRIPNETLLKLDDYLNVNKENLLPLNADFSSINDFDAIIPISAKENDGVNQLIDAITDYIEEGPMFYDEDTVTDQPEKAIAAEIIREKMLWLLDKEIPHGIAIEITKMKEKNKITEINAKIYFEKKTHKGIIIGKNGDMLKKIGTMARADIEKMLDK